MHKYVLVKQSWAAWRGLLVVRLVILIGLFSQAVSLKHSSPAVQSHREGAVAVKWQWTSGKTSPPKGRRTRSACRARRSAGWRARRGPPEKLGRSGRRRPVAARSWEPR